MCGIYGTVDLGEPAAPPRELLSRMGRLLSHRGPDDEGHYFGRGVALGMRRLSIIDLKGGHQPICNESGTVWIVLNGEIYNFLELRSELEKAGHVFTTHSDTEVIVHLYEQEGLEFLQRLRGMFALALWDVSLSKLILARDRLGKKPLYVCRRGGRFFFASEIKAFFQDSEVPRRLNHGALDDYLALGYVPAPATMFEGIEKVLPGHFLEIAGGRIVDREYWDVRFDQIEDLSEQEWIERIRETLLESVRLRLISDVPLGAFLSGGVDSSTVVAAMARLVDRPVKTYSIGFDKEDSYYNELPFARTVAKAFATDHHEIIVRPDVAELLPKLIWHLDEPIADSAFITTYLVSRLARDSVTVILSGVGGDELFGGYRRYLGDSLRKYYQWLPPAVRKKLLPSLLARLPQDRHAGWKNFARYASAFAKTAEFDPVTRYMSYVTVFSRETRAAMMLDRPFQMNANADTSASRALQQYFDRCRNADSLHQNIYVDLKTSLPDDLLALTDKMSMAASVECRAPFIDHKLVELISRFPSFLKVRGLTMKYLLKKSVQPWLPAEILRRKKRGFGAPVGAWLRTGLQDLVREVLSEEQVQRRGLFDPAVVREIISSHHAQTSDHTDHLLAMICLEVWCRVFLDGNDWRYVPEPAAVHAGLH